MKKKFMLAVAAIFAATSLSLSSCGGSPVDKVIDIAQDATEQFKNASSLDELKKMKKDAESKIQEVMLKNLDFEPTDAEIDAMIESRKEFKAAYKKAKKILQ